MDNKSERPIRQKSFLNGRVYFNRRRFSFDCLVRDISAGGARLIFQGAVTLPDMVELYVSNRDETHLAHVQWHRGDQVGVAFTSKKTETERNLGEAADLNERAAALEDQIASLRRMLTELKTSRDAPPNRSAA
jgi:hypothetical protein